MRVAVEIEMDVAAEVGVGIATVARLQMLRCPRGCPPRDDSPVWREMVPRFYSLGEPDPEGRRLVVVTGSDRIELEDAEAAGLVCLQCGAAIPLAEGWSVDFRWPGFD